MVSRAGDTEKRARCRGPRVSGPASFRRLWLASYSL